MQVIERERCTGWSYTETMLHRFLNHPALDRYDLSSVVSVGGGGSPIAPSIFWDSDTELPATVTPSTLVLVVDSYFALPQL